MTPRLSDTQPRADPCSTADLFPTKSGWLVANLQTGLDYSPV